MVGLRQVERERVGGRRSLSVWPESPEAIHAEYDRRERVYLGLEYTDAERTSLNLFEARDTEDRLIAATRRIMRDIGFTVEVDAAAIATTRCTLRVRSDASQSPNTLEAYRVIGDGIWRRSRVQEELASWALRGCYLGRWLFEAQRGEDGLGYIVPHDPRSMRVWRDGFGRVTRALSVYTEPPPPPVLGSSSAPPAGGTTISREITLTEQRTQVGTAPVTVEPIALGVVPVTVWTYRDVGKELPLWAGHGYEHCLASVDSAFTQLHTIGTRQANPLLVGSGVDIGPGADVSAMGRSVAIPAGSDLTWLEPDLKGIDALTAAALNQVTMLRATIFEFLFTEAGSGASGLALSHRASGFVGKIEPIREAFYRALALAVSYALAIELDRTWSEDLDVFVVDGGEALPLDVEAMAALYMTLVREGLLKPVDAIGNLQALGLIPAGDPLVYWAELEAEREAKEARMAAQAADEVSTEPADDEQPDDEQADPAADNGGAADPAGAAPAPLLIGQIVGAREIVADVAAGKIPRTVGIDQLITLISLTTEQA